MLCYISLFHNLKMVDFHQKTRHQSQVFHHQVSSSGATEDAPPVQGSTAMAQGCPGGAGASAPGMGGATGWSSKDFKRKRLGNWKVEGFRRWKLIIFFLTRTCFFWRIEKRSATKRPLRCQRRSRWSRCHAIAATASGTILQRHHGCLGDIRWPTPVAGTCFKPWVAFRNQALQWEILM